MNSKNLLLLIVLISKSVFCIDKTELFTVDVDTLDMLTKSFSKNRNIFHKPSDSSYLLYKAIVINDFILHKYLSEKLSDYICQGSTSDLILLLKWKVSISYSIDELYKSRITCKDEIEKSKLIMEEYFLDSTYADAFIEYYKQIKNIKDGDLIEQWSVLNTNLYKKPDLKIAEMLIQVQHKMFLKNGVKTGEWNASVLAAKYGSKFGIINMMKMLKNYDEKDFDFLQRLSLLWQ